MPSNLSSTSVPPVPKATTQTYVLLFSIIIYLYVNEVPVYDIMFPAEFLINFNFIHKIISKNRLSKYGLKKN